MKQPPVGSRSVRENLAWIHDRAEYAARTEQQMAETLEQIVKRAAFAQAALDKADEALNDWSAMDGLSVGP